MDRMKYCEDYVNSYENIVNGLKSILDDTCNQDMRWYIETTIDDFKKNFESQNNEVEKELDTYYVEEEKALLNEYYNSVL